MQEDGTQPWMVISRCVDRDVTELAVDNTKPIYDEPSTGTAKQITMKQRTEQLTTSSSSSLALPIKQRNWKDFPPFQKLMTPIATKSAT